MIRALPSECGVLRQLLIKHGVLFDSSDYAVYASRLPDSERIALSAAVAAIWNVDKFISIRSLVGDTSADCQQLGYAMLVFRVSLLLDQLCALGHSPFGLGYPYPWDGLETNVITPSPKNIPTWGLLWLDRLFQFRGHLSAPGLWQATSDLAKFGFLDQMKLWLMSAVDKSAVIAGVRAHEVLDVILGNKPTVNMQVCKLHNENREQTIAGLCAGAWYSPWNLNGLLDVSQLCRVVEMSRKWDDVRDATIILQNWPTESKDQALNIVRELCNCVSSGRCEADVALTLWSRIRQLSNGWSLGHVSAFHTATRFEEYESDPRRVVEDAIKLVRSL